MELKAYVPPKRGLTKTLRIVKLTAIILLSFCLQVSAKTWGQTITLNVKDQPIERVFAEIEKQTGYTFTYSQGLLDKLKTVSVNVKDASITETLDQCFKGKPFTYKIVDKIISIDINPSKKNEIIQKELILPLDIKGKVTNEKGESVEGVTVTIKGSKIATSTNSNGEFSIKNNGEEAVLVFTSVNMETFELKVKDQEEIIVKLKTKITEMGGVTINTGYQRLSPERTTGSISQVNNDLLNRSVATNVLSHIENVLPGILFDHGDAARNDQLLIRGRSTIFSNAAPLIVLDNFPYDGDINNINPNDVESISILKDAGAASIWGARAGNGVIVITTKKSKTNKTQVEFNSNVSVSGKPDIYALNALSSTDYINLEKYLFSNNYYSSAFASSAHLPISPVVELLNQAKNGLISQSVANSQIDAFKNYDVRKDINKFFYKKSLNQQYGVNFSGNSSNFNYYFSTGWDHNLPTLVSNSYDRITIRSENVYKLNSNLQAELGFNFTQSTNKSGNNPGYTIPGYLYPYDRFVDDQGNLLPLNNYYRKIFTDTAGGGLLSWKYKPIEDIGYTKNKTKSNDYVINTGIKYRITKEINIEFKYQYENSLNTTSSLYLDSSFFSRDLTNTYYQPQANNKFPVPIGGIIDNSNYEIVSHQGRAQINYSQIFSSKNQISALAGWEIKDMKTTGGFNREYGYHQQGSFTNPQLDFYDFFTQYNNSIASSQIPNPQSVSSTLDRFISYFANASYTFNNKYTLSASGRNDAANLFGINTNQKGVPLWSGGVGWNISKEPFYKSKLIPYLRFRGTYGYNGNFSRLASAFTTVNFGSSNTTSAIMATIQTPPNADLRWEQVRIMNLGFDFEFKNKVLVGSIEYYKKNAKDLIAPAFVDPTLGIGSGSITTYKNVASMIGHGFDVDLTSCNLEKKLKWYTDYVFSYANTEVYNYSIPVSSKGSTYLNAYQVINPIVGKPVYAMYSYRWAGLDPQTGDPQGYLGKTVSKDYTKIYSNTPLDSLIYNGPIQPKYFGSIRNAFVWKNISLSFNISYKFDYYFRKNSVNYSTLFSGWYWNGSGDYSKRWQNPGDEKITNVPSVVYPANALRDNFYQFSEILVEKADNIRLEDIRVDYSFSRLQYPKLPFNRITVYIYANNLGVLWVANKDKIDPYYNGLPKTGMSMTVGAKVIF